MDTAMSSQPTIVVVGAGAAGFFGAIMAAEHFPECRVILLEKTKKLLTKLRISGGCRCNVTHSCFEPKELIQNYPRGGKALLGPFTRFQPTDMINWLKSQGVLLKTEDDGRMFPITDSSETIARCLENAASQHDVEIRTLTGVKEIAATNDGFTLTLTDDTQLPCQRLLLASGSNSHIWKLLEGLSHTIVPPVPSLFTLNIPDSPFVELAGVSVNRARVRIKGSNLEQTGPLLITHWGLSGPAVLKLSAWGARALNEKDYNATVEVNWLADIPFEILKAELLEFKTLFPARQLATEGLCHLPRKLWKKILELAGADPTMRWSHLSNSLLQKILELITTMTFEVRGKSTNKEEFVTCGGVALNEVDFKTMESKLIPNLYFAGEILDIDGVTGGFNFQNAWTTAYIAGKHIGLDL